MFKIELIQMVGCVFAGRSAIFSLQLFNKSAFGLLLFWYIHRLPHNPTSLTQLIGMMVMLIIFQTMLIKSWLLTYIRTGISVVHMNSN